MRQVLDRRTMTALGGHAARSRRAPHATRIGVPPQLIRRRWAHPRVKTPPRARCSATWPPMARPTVTSRSSARSTASRRARALPSALRAHASETGCEAPKLDSSARSCRPRSAHCAASSFTRRVYPESEEYGRPARGRSRLGCGRRGHGGGGRAGCHPTPAAPMAKRKRGRPKRVDALGEMCQLAQLERWQEVIGRRFHSRL